MDFEFKVGDRVKCWYRDRWWPGTVVAIQPRQITEPIWRFAFCGGRECDYVIIERNEKTITYEHPRLHEQYVLTDEMVSTEPGAIFNGFGLRSWARPSSRTVPENEFLK